MSTFNEEQIYIAISNLLNIYCAECRDGNVSSFDENGGIKIDIEALNKLKSPEELESDEDKETDSYNDLINLLVESSDEVEETCEEDIDPEVADPDDYDDSNNLTLEDTYIPIISETDITLRDALSEDPEAATILINIFNKNEDIQVVKYSYSEGSETLRLTLVG